MTFASWSYRKRHTGVIAGLWTLRSWAWMAAMVLFGLDLALQAALYVSFGGGALALVRIATVVVYVTYLYAVRGAYVSSTGERSVPSPHGL